MKIKKLLDDFLSIFIWNDGNLLKAVKEGGIYLLDEINLVSDSVLERLN